MALNQISALTKLLIDNPTEIKELFTVVFGKYLLNYYPETKDYSVQFDTSAESSYQDSRHKRIVIALSNVVLLLKNNIHPFAVAYHELAHVLYTSDSKRDNIRVKVLQNLYGLWGFQPRSDLPHTIWNILEDERIERKLVKDYPFLKSLINPLRTAVTEDGKLMSWRCQKDLSKVPADIVQQAELYASKDLKISDCVNIITYIIDQHYKPAPGEDGSEIADKVFKDGGDNAGGMSGGDTSNEDGDTEDSEEESDAEGNGDAEDSEEESEDAEDSILDELDDEDEDADDSEEQEEKDKKQVAQELKDIKKTIEELKNMTSNDPQEEALRKMLLEVKEAQKTQHDLRQFNDAVKTIKKTVSNSPQLLDKIDKCRSIINLSQDIKGGLTSAQRKSYSSNISNRINVQKIIDSSASRKEPRVFYGKGKDVSYLRKVVIFEDVSGSTSGFLTSIFSDIAFNLQKSFEGSEWWIYADSLAMKPKQDYAFKSFDGNAYEYNCGGGTSSENLVHVMRKYRKENAIFVIITDGDIYPLINTEDNLFEEFKDKSVLIGVGINNDITQVVPNKYDITDSYTQFQDLWRNRNRGDDTYDYKEKFEDYMFRINPNIKHKYEEIVADAVRSLMPIIKGRLK